jgi:hypothetical protein
MLETGFCSFQVPLKMGFCCFVIIEFVYLCSSDVMHCNIL